VPRVAIEAGTMIGGKYRVEGVIGEGGMGVVLSAFHLELERRVAIKVIRPDLPAEDSVAKRMLLEARHAASITNEHIARVLDLGRLDSGAPYIVMEYLEGRSLYELVQARGPLAPLEAVDYLMEACEAVAEAHSRGIVHRDLKPENLFLAMRADGTPTIKVLDFGVSKSVSGGAMELTNPSTAVGSPHYMAPEQMRAKDDVDGRADVYALGAILFELLTGRPPFEADDIPTLCTLVLNTPPPSTLSLRAAVPTELDQVIQRCLEKNPGDRYRTVADLCRVLRPFGSELARTSLERVTRVLGDEPPPRSMRAPPPVHDLRLAATLELETLPEPALAAPATDGTRRWLLVSIAAVVLSALGLVAALGLREPPKAMLSRALGGVVALTRAVRPMPPQSASAIVVAPVAPSASTLPAPTTAQRPPALRPRPSAKPQENPASFGGRK
jgi:eukaryotic-like serine/threonine-protein kinase